MRTVRPVPILTAIATVVAALSLTGCGMTISFDKNDEGDQPVDTQQPAQPPETAQPEDQPVDQSSGNANNGANTDANSGSSTSSGTDTNSGSSTSSGSSSSAGSSSSGSSSSSSGSSSSSSSSDSSSTGSGSSDPGYQLDKKGSGKIPEAVLEKNIRDTYAKQGTTVENVDCYADLRVYAGTGSQSCTVTAPGGKKYYGVVKVVNVVGNQVEYKLEFAGIDF